MVPNGNKDKRLSSVNHTTKATHRHHHRHEFCKEKRVNAPYSRFYHGFSEYRLNIVLQDVCCLQLLQGNLPLGFQQISSFKFIFRWKFFQCISKMVYLLL